MISVEINASKELDKQRKASWSVIENIQPFQAWKKDVKPNMMLIYDDLMIMAIMMKFRLWKALSDTLFKGQPELLRRKSNKNYLHCFVA